LFDVNIAHFMLYW